MTDPSAPGTDEPDPVETADPADNGPEGAEQDLEDQKEALPDDVERFQGG